MALTDTPSSKLDSVQFESGPVLAAASISRQLESGLVLPAKKLPDSKEIMTSMVQSIAVGALVLLACERNVAQSPPVGVSDKSRASVPSHRPVAYAFDSLDDRPVTSEAMRGKPAVIAFVTTGDLLGQAQINYLVAMAKNDGDKVNYAIVALHPRKEIVLVVAYAKALKVDFPVALGDPSSTTSEAGPFGAIDAVPTTIVLARDGHMMWKHTGLAKSEELRAHMHGL